MTLLYEEGNASKGFNDFLHALDWITREEVEDRFGTRAEAVREIHSHAEAEVQKEIESEAEKLVKQVLEESDNFYSYSSSGYGITIRKFENEDVQSSEVEEIEQVVDLENLPDYVTEEFDLKQSDNVETQEDEEEIRVCPLCAFQGTGDEVKEHDCKAVPEGETRESVMSSQLEGLFTYATTKDAVEEAFDHFEDNLREFIFGIVDIAKSHAVSDQDAAILEKEIDRQLAGYTDVIKPDKGAPQCVHCDSHSTYYRSDGDVGCNGCPAIMPQ